MSKLKDHVAEHLIGLSRLNADGSETLDPRPVEVPIGFEKPESIQSLIRRLVTDPNIRAELDEANIETFDEADDFEIQDDIPLQSPHEDHFDPLHLLARDQEIRSGTVKPRSVDEIAQARKLLEEHKKKPDSPAGKAA